MPRVCSVSNVVELLLHLCYLLSIIFMVVCCSVFTCIPLTMVGRLANCTDWMDEWTVASRQWMACVHSEEQCFYILISLIKYRYKVMRCAWLGIKYFSSSTQFNQWTFRNNLFIYEWWSNEGHSILLTNSTVTIFWYDNFGEFFSLTVE